MDKYILIVSHVILILLTTILAVLDPEGIFFFLFLYIFPIILYYLADETISKKVLIFSSSLVSLLCIVVIDGSSKYYDRLISYNIEPKLNKVFLLKAKDLIEEHYIYHVEEEKDPSLSFYNTKLEFYIRMGSEMNTLELKDLYSEKVVLLKKKVEMFDVK